MAFNKPRSAGGGDLCHAVRSTHQDHTSVKMQLRVRGLSDKGVPSSSVKAPIKARELPIWNVCQAIMWRRGRFPDITAFRSILLLGDSDVGRVCGLSDMWLG